MADFPGSRFLPPVISSISRYSIGVQLQLTGSAAPSSGTWTSANIALFVPLVLPGPYLVQKVWWANGSAVAGNVDCGVYALGGQLLFAAGATAQSGTNVVQSVALGSPFLMSPGSYYLALSASSTSATFFRGAPTAVRLQSLGLAQQASAEPLPSTFTLAAMTQALYPVCGIARITTI